MPRIAAPSAAAVALMLCATACDRGASDAAPAATDEAAEAAAPAAEEPAADALACDLVRAVAQIEAVRLESEDGHCRVFVPSGATPGQYAVRVSAAGTEDGAAVELTREDGTLYATSGTVTLTAVGDGAWAGSVDASDDAEPGTGTIQGSFDLSGD